MTIDAADAIWTILVEHAGANESGRRDFVQLQTNDPTREYRFQGLLRFGGKFWNYDRRWYVTCYPEDETPERTSIIAKVNALLAELKKRKDGEPCQQSKS